MMLRFSGSLETKTIWKVSVVTANTGGSVWVAVHAPLPIPATTWPLSPTVYMNQGQPSKTAKGNRPLDDIDRELLNIIQADFPICRSPYDVLGERVGITGDEVLQRMNVLSDAGIIRRIGASFDSRRLGHASILVAARVPADRLNEVAAIVSSFPEVTHNYGRDFEYNLWFTLVCNEVDQINTVIDNIRCKTGITDIHSLPAEKMFKIKVDFKF